MKLDKKQFKEIWQTAWDEGYEQGRKDEYIKCTPRALTN